MAIFRYLGKYQAIPFSQVTTSAREHFQAIVCNCVRRQGFSICFPKSNIARISELPFPPLHSLVASLAASFLKKSLDQQYDLFKCLSGYTGRRERRRLTNIIFCIIAHFLLFFFTMPTSSWCDVGKKVTSPYKMVYSIRKRSTFCCPV